MLSTISGLLGQTLYVHGRFEDVEQLGRLAKDLATEDDVDTQALWRSVLAKIAARQGSFEEAQSLINEALEILAPTDAVLLRYGTLLDLAEVHRLAGREDHARAALEEALELAVLKQSPVMIAEVQAQLAAGVPPARLLADRYPKSQPPCSVDSTVTREIFSLLFTTMLARHALALGLAEQKGSGGPPLCTTMSIFSPFGSVVLSIVNVKRRTLDARLGAVERRRVVPRVAVASGSPGSSRSSRRGSSPGTGCR